MLLATFYAEKVKTITSLPVRKQLTESLKVSRLQSETKIMGKSTIWTIMCFSPLPFLKNVEEQREKLASSNVIGSQHCIGGEGEF